MYSFTGFFALKGDSVQLIENEAVRDDFVIIGAGLTTRRNKKFRGKTDRNQLVGHWYGGNRENENRRIGQMC